MANIPHLPRMSRIGVRSPRFIVKLSCGEELNAPAPRFTLTKRVNSQNRDVCRSVCSFEIPRSVQIGNQRRPFWVPSQPFLS